MWCHPALKADQRLDPAGDALMFEGPTNSVGRGPVRESIEDPGAPVEESGPRNTISPQAATSRCGCQHRGGVGAPMILAADAGRRARDDHDVGDSRQARCPRMPGEIPAQCPHERGVPIHVPRRRPASGDDACLRDSASSPSGRTLLRKGPSHEARGSQGPTRQPLWLSEARGTWETRPG